MYISSNIQLITDPVSRAVGIVFRSETKFPILTTYVREDKKSEIRIRGVSFSNSVKVQLF